MRPQSYVTEMGVAKKSNFDHLLFFESWLVWVKNYLNSCRTDSESWMSQLSNSVRGSYGPFQKCNTDVPGKCVGHRLIHLCTTAPFTCCMAFGLWPLKANWVTWKLPLYW